jgi:transposase
MRRERPYKGDASHGGRGEGGDNVSTYAWTVGVDWGGTHHHVAVLDSAGAVRGTRIVTHSAAAMTEAVQWIQQVTAVAPEAIAVAIETPRGVLVDSLIEHGFAVFAINPKQIDRFRDRFSAAGAKDDPRDARVLADALRTDARAFRRVRPDDPKIIYLRELCRIVEELQEEELRLTNRLREQLYRVDAVWLTLSPAADDAWLWDLLQVTAHPDRWAQVSRRSITAVLRAHRIRRTTTDDVVAALQRPRLRAATGVADAVAVRIASLIPQLQLVREQRQRTERDIERALAELAESSEDQPREHRDVHILRSLPGAGRTVTATMLTEAAGPLAARDYALLRAHAGTAPVTKRSSKRTFHVQMRYACKHRLRQALYHWARTSIQYDAPARAYYDALRRRGHHHARALRSVADRWLRILIAMLNNGTLYDPSRFELKSN